MNGEMILALTEAQYLLEHYPQRKACTRVMQLTRVNRERASADRCCLVKYATCIY